MCVYKSTFQPFRRFRLQAPNVVHQITRGGSSDQCGHAGCPNNAPVHNVRQSHRCLQPHQFVRSLKISVNMGFQRAPVDNHREVPMRLWTSVQKLVIVLCSSSEMFYVCRAIQTLIFSMSSLQGPQGPQGSPGPRVSVCLGVTV